MKRIIIPVPKGFDAIKIEVPEEFVHLLKVKAVNLKELQPSATTIIFDEAK